MSLEQELTDAKRKLDERKTIEKAKGRIMERDGCFEREAYDRLRKQSMAQAVPMAELAGRILDEK